MQLINYSLITLRAAAGTRGHARTRGEGGAGGEREREDGWERLERKENERLRSRLISDYLAKISLKCCSCGNDIIRVRQGQLAVIKVGRKEGGGGGRVEREERPEGSGA